MSRMFKFILRWISAIPFDIINGRTARTEARYQEEICVNFVHT